MLQVNDTVAFYMVGHDQNGEFIRKPTPQKVVSLVGIYATLDNNRQMIKFELPENRYMIKGFTDAKLKHYCAKITTDAYNEMIAAKAAKPALNDFYFHYFVNNSQ